MEPRSKPTHPEKRVKVEEYGAVVFVGGHRRRHRVAIPASRPRLVAIAWASSSSHNRSRRCRDEDHRPVFLHLDLFQGELGFDLAPYMPLHMPPSLLATVTTKPVSSKNFLVRPFLIAKIILGDNHHDFGAFQRLIYAQPFWRSRLAAPAK